MADSARVKFDQWYDTPEGKVFDFRKETEMYCMNDVVLLSEACLKYRKELIECMMLDPFNFTTLSSCCMGVFKTHFLAPKTLALTHNNAYIHQHKSFSNVSIEWLEYVKKTRNVDIHHALNHGEVKFGSFFVDGFYEDAGVMQVLRNAYNLDVEVMWECQWRELKKTDPDVINFMSTYSGPKRLKPRDALYGGANECLQVVPQSCRG